MRIFITSFWIACKHSSRRLLCLLCIMIVFAGLGGAALSALPEDSAQKIRVGVRDLDNSTLTRMALQTTLSNQGLSQLFQMEFLGPEDSQEGYDLLLTIPEGFFKQHPHRRKHQPYFGMYRRKPSGSHAGSADGVGGDRRFDQRPIRGVYRSGDGGVRERNVR